MPSLNQARSFAWLALVSCSKAEPPRPAPVEPPAVVASALADPPRRERSGTLDVTFVVASDTHVGYLYPDERGLIPDDPVAEPRGLETDVLSMIRRVNALEGQRGPFGGQLARPRGLVVTGDLTEWGRKQEWQHWVALFGLHGTEGALRVPVFEMVGNHDTVDNGPWIAQRVAERHAGQYYAWDWDDLHLVALGEAPDAQALAFLAKDLAALAADVPVVVFFHRALLGPWSTHDWFDDGGFKEQLRVTLQGHRVLGIFHGHHHARGHYVWNGIDVWKPGAVKHGAHTVAVVHVTSERIELGWHDWDHDRYADRWTKPLAR